ncbi:MULTISPECIES: hypothetical protein, partial [Nostoc]|uniref:hypothetical protein n=1 Tax=Nostoc TaxID=1177 RepID=UPI001A7ECBB8
PSNPHFLVLPDGDRSFRANPCNSLLVSFHDSRMSLIQQNSRRRHIQRFLTLNAKKCSIAMVSHH